MEVITIESEAFRKILNQLEEIKAEFSKRQPSLAASWLDNNEVLNLLKVSKRTLQSYRDEGKVAFSQIGAKIYYKASDIEDFLKNHYIKAYKRLR